MVRVQQFSEDTPYGLSRKVEEFLNDIGEDRLIHIGYTTYSIGRFIHHIAYITYKMGG